MCRAFTNFYQIEGTTIFVGMYKCNQYLLILSSVNPMYNILILLMASHYATECIEISRFTYTVSCLQVYVMVCRC